MSDTIHSCSPFCTLPACVKERQRRDFEEWFSSIENGRVTPDMFDINGKGEYALSTIYGIFYGWQAATERATALERERCAVLCETNQVAHSMRGGNTLVNWHVGTPGFHEGMTYAKAIRQRGAV